MKPLELTPEQKDKLLKMCNYFYKDKIVNNNLVTEVVICDQYGTCKHHASENAKTHVYIATTMGFPMTIIHWFEFCVIWLAEKILGTDCSPETKLSIYKTEISSFNDIHPVDSLYREFLKLK